MGDLGLLGITVEGYYGGIGMGYLAHVVAVEEIARASASVSLSYGAHSNLCVNQIRLNGSEVQKEKYLPGLISGQAAGSKGITAFLIEKKMAGFSASPHFDKLGMRGSNTAESIFEDVEVPFDNVLGEEGKGVRVLMSGLDYECVVLSGIGTGIMATCLDEIMPHMIKRKQFGQSIGSFQLMQGKIADMYTKMNSARAYVYEVAKACDRGEVTRQDAAACVLYASEEAMGAAHQAVQAMAGHGWRGVSERCAGCAALP